MKTKEIKAKIYYDEKNRMRFKSFRQYDFLGRCICKITPENEKKLINDIYSKKIPFSNKNNYCTISDKETIIKYSTKTAPKINRKNKYAAKATIVTISTIAAIFLLKNWSNNLKNKNKDKENEKKFEIENNEHSYPNLTNTENIIKNEYEPIVIDYDKYTDKIDLENLNIISDYNLIQENSNIQIPVYEINYENRYNSISLDEYDDIIKEYSNIYGLDDNLVKAIICQENPYNEKNYSDIGGHGLMQIESVWQDEMVSAFNHEENQYENIFVDTMEVTDNDEYGIKVGCMILNNYYNDIKKNYNIDKKFLSESDCIVASVFAYNKGINEVKKWLDNSSSFEEFMFNMKNYSSDGDNEYIEHVFSYLPDGYIIKMTDKNGNIDNVCVDNTLVDTFKNNIHK